MLGEWDEGVRWHELALLGTPAQQRFRTDDPAGGQFDEGLVDHRDKATGDGVLEQFGEVFARGVACGFCGA